MTSPEPQTESLKVEETLHSPPQVRTPCALASSVVTSVALMPCTSCFVGFVIVPAKFSGHVLPKP